MSRLLGRNVGREQGRVHNVTEGSHQTRCHVHVDGDSIVVMPRWAEPQRQQ